MTPKTESRPMSSIRELSIRGSMDVFVKRGEPSMTVIAEKPEDVITEFRGGVLTITQKPTMVMGGGANGMFCVGDNNVQNSIQIGHANGSVTISRGGGVTQVFYGSVGNVSGRQGVMQGVSVSLGQQVTVEITVPELPAASIQGSGNLYLEGLQQPELELEITGSGTIRASGQVQRLSAEISGSGDVKAKELLVDNAELRVSGSGDIKAQATKSLSARVSGSGDIKVWGNPAVRDTRVSGSGEIAFK